MPGSTAVEGSLALGGDVPVWPHAGEVVVVVTESMDVRIMQKAPGGPNQQ